MNKRKTTKRGGKRKGSGRPLGSIKKEPTVVMRVPASKVDEVKKIISSSDIPHTSSDNLPEPMEENKA